MTSATEDLRRMLNKLGVEWWPMHDVENSYHQDRDTEFVIDGKKYMAHECGTLIVYGLTPAQAVEATLGRGTCKLTPDDHYRVDAVETSWGCVCSACGAFHKFNHGEKWAFCPSCGREVVE